MVGERDPGPHSHEGATAGVAAMAAGLASRAVALADEYVGQREVYGKPIRELGAIADHLLQMRALQLVVTALSVKAAAAANFAGPGGVQQGWLAGRITGEIRALGARAELDVTGVLRDTESPLLMLAASARDEWLAAESVPPASRMSRSGSEEKASAPSVCALSASHP